MKRCFKCQTHKPLDAFYVHPQMADGHLNKCKECTKSDVRNWYCATREKRSEYERTRFKTEARKQSMLKSFLGMRARNPEKSKARQLVARSLRSGRITKPLVCDGCKQTKPLQAHHHDYSRPLDVSWYCFVCHRTIGHGQVVVSKHVP